MTSYLEKLTQENYKKDFPAIIKEYLRGKVCELPSTELVVVYLYFWENYGLQEISEELKIKYSEIESIYENAIFILKEKITSDYKETISPISA